MFKSMPKSRLDLSRVKMGLDKSLNQSLQGGSYKISYMSNNGPLGNCCKVPNKHIIGHVLEGQNGGSIVARSNVAFLQISTFSLTTALFHLLALLFATFGVFCLLSLVIGISDLFPFVLIILDTTYLLIYRNSISCHQW